MRWDVGHCVSLMNSWGWAERVLGRLFLRKEMELSLIGLQGAGKTSLVNVLATGGFEEDMIPTVRWSAISSVLRKISYCGV